MFDISEQTIISIIGDNNDTPEVEAKFKNINLDIVKSIKAMLEYDYNPIQRKTKDVFLDGERYSFTDEGLFLTTKRRLKDFFVKDDIRNIKLSISTEKNIEILAEDDNQNSIDLIQRILSSKHIRNKDRTTYIINSSQIDITIVDGKAELEVELIDDITEKTWNNFTETIEYVSTLIHYTKIIKDFNKWVTLEEEYHKDNYYFLTTRASTNPRNFKPGDFVWGGLLGGLFEYTITTKSDGVRRHMVIRKDGVYLVKPKRGFPVIERIAEGNKDFHGSVIDGEWVNNSIFIPFDCMSYKETSKIQLKTHVYSQGVTRMSAVKKILSSISLPVKIIYKNFYLLGKTREDMYSALHNISSEKTDLGTDGYIITPNDFRYKVILSKDEKRWKDRTLIDTPDILKLKPWDMLTVDMVVKSSDYFAYTINKNKRELERFEGTKLTPFGRENINYDNIIFDEVIEMGPMEGTEQNPILQFTRLREDKDSPNTTDVAESVWKDLHQPIWLDSLLGIDFKFLRLGFNQIKNKIIKNWKDKSIIDIGSGKGSDLNKWHKNGVKEILAIEPNRENLDELERRLNNFKDNINVTTLQSGGEDTSKIIRKIRNISFAQGKIPVISSMLSLSFFWSSKEMLKGLATTLLAIKKEFGAQRMEFVFFTIEKSRTLRVFEHFGSKNIKLGPSSLKLSSGGIVDIYLPDTIVGEQREYLVSLDLLTKMLKGELEVEDINDGIDYILSDDEKIFSSMYVVGKIIF